MKSITHKQYKFIVENTDKQEENEICKIHNYTTKGIPLVSVYSDLICNIFLFL